MDKITTEKNNYNYNGVPGPAGGGVERGVPAIRVDAVRGGRKGDPKHKCCGEKTVGSESSKYRCVVKIGFQKKSLRKER